MSWFYGQTWLWYLVAFAVGVLLSWLVGVLPARRRLRAATPTAPPDTGDGHPERAATAGVSITDVPPDEDDLFASRPARDADTVADLPAPRPTPDLTRPALRDAVTERLPAVDPAMSTLDTAAAFGVEVDSATGRFRAVSLAKPTPEGPPTEDTAPEPRADAPAELPESPRDR